MSDSTYCVDLYLQLRRRGRRGPSFQKIKLIRITLFICASFFFIIVIARRRSSDDCAACPWQAISNTEEIASDYHPRNDKLDKTKIPSSTIRDEGCLRLC